MKILVTGGSGYLGTHMCSFLNADDFSRRSGLDILNLQDVYKAEEYDLVIHLAALLDKDPDNAENVFLSNVEGTVNLLRMMKPGSTFIFASTKDVYGRFADNHQLVPESCETIYSGQSALEWSKLIAEKYVRFYAEQKNFRSCVFRLSNVYAKPTENNTPNAISHFAELIKAEEPIRLPARGRPIRDLLYVNDFARACMAFQDSVIRHGLYNLGGGEDNSLTMLQLVELMADIADKSLNIDEEHPLPAPVPLNYTSDIALARNELDWDPVVSNEDGIKKLFQ